MKTRNAWMGAAMFKLWRWRKCTADGLRMPAERVTRAGHLRVDSSVMMQYCSTSCVLVLVFKSCWWRTSSRVNSNCDDATVGWIALAAQLQAGQYTCTRICTPMPEGIFVLCTRVIWLTTTIHWQQQSHQWSESSVSLVTSCAPVPRSASGDPSEA